MIILFNATFNIISDILWRLGLLVKETGEPGENHRPVQITDCIGSYISNYHTTTMAHGQIVVLY